MNGSNVMKPLMENGFHRSSEPKLLANSQHKAYFRTVINLICMEKATRSRLRATKSTLRVCIAVVTVADMQSSKREFCNVLDTYDPNL